MSQHTAKHKLDVVLSALSLVVAPDLFAHLKECIEEVESENYTRGLQDGTESGYQNGFEAGFQST